MSLVEWLDCGGPRLLHEFHRSHNHLFGPVADEQHDDCGKTDKKGGRSRPSNFVVTPVSRLGRVSCALIAMPEVLERLITYSGRRLSASSELTSSPRRRVEHGVDRLSHGGRCVL